jgi:hypothetical protein
MKKVIRIFSALSLMLAFLASGTSFAAAKVKPGKGKKCASVWKQKKNTNHMKKGARSSNWRYARNK